MYRIKNELYVTMNYANPGYHVLEIDKNYRIFKGRYCEKYQRLTFQNISKVIIRYLDFEEVKNWTIV